MVSLGSAGSLLTLSMKLHLAESILQHVLIVVTSAERAVKTR